MMTRLLALIGTAIVVLLGATVLGSGVASAHSVVTASNPDDKSAIDAGPERVSVTFNEALQDTFAALTVVGPDGNLWSKGTPTVEGPTVSVPVGELGPVGEYTIAYRVTSADGHAVSGTRTFTLTKEGTGSPGVKADASPDTEGTFNWFWLLLGAAVVLFGLGLGFALRNPRSKS